MTAKEKAKEFFDKYYIVCQEYTEEIQCSIQAKQCALIAVDEIIQQWEVIDTYIADLGGQLNQSLKYWQEVKQEIQAL
jgi:uncharacterized protein YhfF